MDICTKFISVYLPTGLDAVGVVKLYVDDIPGCLKLADDVYVEMGHGSLGMHSNSNEAVFTGRLFVYTEQSITDERIAEFTTYCLAKGVKLVWRDTRYSLDKSRYEKPEAFICHDSRDKELVARPLAIEMMRIVCPVWYDEFSLKVGDSLRECIDRGIKDAKKCILILSPNFCSNGRWGKRELDSIFAREVHDEQNVILPVWHDITSTQVYEFCAVLNDRVAVNTSLGIPEVAGKLRAALATSLTTK